MCHPFRRPSGPPLSLRVCPLNERCRRSFRCGQTCPGRSSRRSSSNSTPMVTLYSPASVPSEHSSSSCRLMTRRLVCSSSTVPTVPLLAAEVQRTNSTFPSVTSSSPTSFVMPLLGKLCVRST
eukprot:Lithocolla_globosa_v1_NODE_1095_length_2875_cov_9.641135.p4 type:complete len:123 gc:universal NODE_1095_length_2875_cov_9.641135:162-530(+)